jgi:N-formylglutamate deformylase
MGPPPFELFEPRTSEETPLVVEIPHAGIHVDPESMACSIAPVRAIGRDADLYVDALFEGAHALGATVLVARWSRHVVDLNRARDELDGHTAEGGTATNLPRGVVWRTTTDGEPILARRLDRREVERRLALVYDPYHAALEAALARKRARFGYAVLLAAHSMPTEGRRAADGPPRADVVPGTQGRTTASASLIDAVEREARAEGLSVRHDDPYRGGWSTRRHGRPREHTHAVQIELARRLYMNETTLAPTPSGWERTARFAARVVTALGRTPPF